MGLRRIYTKEQAENKIKTEGKTMKELVTPKGNLTTKGKKMAWLITK